MEISRRIEIDCGHRVPNHSGQCKNLHGHRYVIDLFAAPIAKIEQRGANGGMVVDFGFLKNLLIEHVHQVCDHTTILWQKDANLCTLVKEDSMYERVRSWGHFKLGNIPQQFLDYVFSNPNLDHIIMSGYMGPIVVTRNTPTAENLGAMWLRLIMRTTNRQQHWANIKLTKMHVYETPNSCAEVLVEDLEPLLDNDDEL